MTNIFDRSILAVKNGISGKLDYSTAYYGRNNTVRNMVTDMDHFPYTRFFRGNPSSEAPIVFNREAGYRKVENNCYKGTLVYPQPIYPEFCFETACSTVYPCVPSYIHKTGNFPALDVMLNKSCVMKSP